MVEVEKSMLIWCLITDTISTCVFNVEMPYIELTLFQCMALILQWAPPLAMPKLCRHSRFYPPPTREGAGSLRDHLDLTGLANRFLAA